LNAILIIRKRKIAEIKSAAEDKDEDKINDAKPLFEARGKNKQKTIFYKF
jgi:hypothetical protein